jgi:hypothetical protein
MVNITLNGGGPTYNFPMTTQLQWAVQVGMTPMPIPLLQTPLLLNFGGAQPTIIIDWTVTTSQTSTGTVEGDWQLLVGWSGSGPQSNTNFASGNTTVGYTLNIPEMGQSGMQGFVTQMQLTYVAGQPNTFTASMTFALGTVI